MRKVRKKMSFWDKMTEVLKDFSVTQIMVFGVLFVVALCGIGIGGFLSFSNREQQQIVAGAEAETEEATEWFTEGTETDSITEETETETEIATEAGPVLVKLVGSSIERDLKVKIQTEDKKNIKGEEFYISVKRDKKNAAESIYNDHDKDGIIYIKDMDGGDYIVALQDVEF